VVTRKWKKRFFFKSVWLTFCVLFYTQPRQNIRKNVIKHFCTIVNGLKMITCKIKHIQKCFCAVDFSAIAADARKLFSGIVHCLKIGDDDMEIQHKTFARYFRKCFCFTCNHVLTRSYNFEFRNFEYLISCFFSICLSWIHILFTQNSVKLQRLVPVSRYFNYFVSLFVSRYSDMFNV